MDVRDCPKCGSDNIDTSSGSAEYSHWVRWDCEDCDWSYKNGSGMGTGSRSSGTHPRKLSGGQQDTLTPTGEYCANCEVVVAGDHACTPKAVLQAAEADELSQEDVVDALDEWHTHPETELREGLGGNVALTPTFYRVTRIDENEDPAMFGEVLNEMRRIIETQDADDDRDGEVRSTELKDRLAAETDVESAYIDHCLSQLKRRGDIRLGLTGWTLTDNE